MSLLIQEPPLQVLPTLAHLIGLNEAIILQQVHYWVQRSNNVRDGYKWVYNSYQEWYKQMPLWKSETTMRTAFKNLEKMGLLITANYNKAKFDKTKWYRINYEKLSLLENKARSAKNWQTKNQDLADGDARNWQTYTKRLPETTSETNNKYSASPSAAPSVSQLEDEFEVVWSKYPNKKGKKQAFNHYKAWRRKSTKHTNEYLLKKLDEYIRYVEQRRRTGFPSLSFMNGSTWFNGRFDDEIKTNNAPITTNNKRIYD